MGLKGTRAENVKVLGLNFYIMLHLFSWQVPYETIDWSGTHITHFESGLVADFCRTSRFTMGDDHLDEVYDIAEMDWRQ